MATKLIHSCWKDKGCSPGGAASCDTAQAYAEQVAAGASAASGGAIDPSYSGWRFSRLPWSLATTSSGP